jgi:hypothetical protein
MSVPRIESNAYRAITISFHKLSKLLNYIKGSQNMSYKVYTDGTNVLLLTEYEHLPEESQKWRYIGLMTADEVKDRFYS